MVFPGSYIYMEASSPATRGQSAVLNSKTIKKPPGGVKCLTFWYHMFGWDMGTLTVIMKDSVTLAETIVATLAGNNGRKWNKSEVDINVSNDFQVGYPLFLSIAKHLLQKHGRALFLQSVLN